jgi:EAL domain-containing protein (putative c-di-GMP-specific phosphodiesterase class I)
VGTREQLAFLEARGCHCFQGFWAAKPMPAGEFLAYVEAQAAVATAAAG